MLVPLKRKYFPGVPVVQLSQVQVVMGEITRLEYWVAMVLPGDSREMIRLPGATRSGFTTWSKSVGPLELKLATVSSKRVAVPLVLVAPTVITLGSLPGELMVA